jgi:hypothetical protein
MLIEIDQRLAGCGLQTRLKRFVKDILQGSRLMPINEPKHTDAGQ